jgi:hypothetical protein
MRRVLVLITAIVFVAGCLPDGARRRDKVDPFDYMYPKEVDWGNPEQVLKSYYGAKKRGDWKKAFRICDFAEVLPREEADKIREEWKKDSVNWSERYLFQDWYVVEKERKGDTAVMAVMHLYASREAEKGTAQANYSEVLKLYGKKWKLVAALSVEEGEEEPADE